MNEWCWQHSAVYRERLQRAGFHGGDALSLDTLVKLPLLTRRDLQQQAQALYCQPPASHLPVAETFTSGSTGEPVTLHRSAVSQLFWQALTMREHQWWQRDLSGRLAAIKASFNQPRVDTPSWGAPASLFASTGPAVALSMSMGSEALADALIDIDPDYLLVFPSQLQAIQQCYREQGRRPARLKQIRCMSEVVTPELRATVAEDFSLPLCDVYSSQEAGVIAIQCPHSGLYHIMAESLLVEVVNDQLQPCAEGEVGRVVITDLHNFATPLVRYEIGDYAEVGPPCGCGRQLPTLKRILGRQRNMAIYPDGHHYWPRLGFYRFRDIAPILQFQVAQLSVDTLECRLYSERPLNSAEEGAIAEVIRSAMGYPFAIGFRYFDQPIPASGGKYEEFVRLF
ncbi:phenylacetate--CoA ligase family protein [Pseudomaricurvus sp. HS19]|uniref:phenylacetate--CoA ligase family protein n=1 Tax=Pseudomaricurvus sp. HS19 TaxID=2692626 RepID=UPI00136B3418|nr:phenylacetate--CoA ligase family protein [Pseudomaricurvus sp. HS19]MYM64785.1 phenylacetate--CoA ligase family protein [Pseudomaricurvus sp. HS19]